MIFVGNLDLTSPFFREYAAKVSDSDHYGDISSHIGPHSLHYMVSPFLV